MNFLSQAEVSFRVKPAGEDVRPYSDAGVSRARESIFALVRVCRLCEAMRARSACLLGLGDRGHPRDPAGSLRVAGPYERPPSHSGPPLALRCIALHRVAVYGVLVWARGHRSQTHRGGSQHRESLRCSRISMQLSKMRYFCPRAKDIETRIIYDRASPDRENRSRGSRLPRGASFILSTAVLRPRRFSGWVKDFAWKVHTEKTWRTTRREGEKERKRKREKT